MMHHQRCIFSFRKWFFFLAWIFKFATDVTKMKTNRIVTFQKSWILVKSIFSYMQEARGILNFKVTLKKHISRSHKFLKYYKLLLLILLNIKYMLNYHYVNLVASIFPQNCISVLLIEQDLHIHWDSTSTNEIWQSVLHYWKKDLACSGNAMCKLLHSAA